MTIEKKLKTLFIEEKIKITEIAKKLAEKRNKKVLPNSVSQKINRNTMKFNEVEEILDILGYEIVFQKKQK